MLRLRYQIIAGCSSIESPACSREREPALGRTRWSWGLKALMLWLAVSLVGCDGPAVSNPGIPLITPDEFTENVLENSKPVIVLFRNNSSPSHRVRMLLNDVHKNYLDLAEVVMVQTDEHPELAARHGIEVVPTLAVFSKGKLVVQYPGEISDRQISVWLDIAMRDALMHQQGMTSLPVTELTEDNFDTFLAEDDSFVLVDYWATWCGPCLRVAPHVDMASLLHAGELRVGKVDIDAAPKVANRYSQGSVPFVVIFKNGQEVSRRTGAIPGHHFRQWVNDTLHGKSAASSLPASSNNAATNTATSSETN